MLRSKPDIDRAIGTSEPGTSVNTLVSPSGRTRCGLDWLNFFLADVQTGVGPFLAIYLAGYGWNEQRVGLALTAGGIAGILSQTPAGALVDRLRSKRALLAAGIAALAGGALLIALLPTFWSVMSAQVLIGGTSSVFGPAICASPWGSLDTGCLIAARDVTRRSIRQATSSPRCQWACSAISSPIAASFSSL